MRLKLAFVVLSLVGAPDLDPALKVEVEARVSVVREWSSDPEVLSAVKEANRKLRTPEAILEIDRKWQDTVGVDDFMRALIESPCGRRLRALRSAHPELAEAFVTDRLGANVAMTNKTSDFYQGDEDKFREAMAGGKGALHIGRVAFDESIQAYAVAMAVPVVDQGAPIGVLVVTVNLEKLKRMMKNP